MILLTDTMSILNNEECLESLLSLSTSLNYSNVNITAHLCFLYVLTRQAKPAWNSLHAQTGVSWVLESVVLMYIAAYSVSADTLLKIIRWVGGGGMGFIAVTSCCFSSKWCIVGKSLSIMVFDSDMVGIVCRLLITILTRLFWYRRDWCWELIKNLILTSITLAAIEHLLRRRVYFVEIS